MSQTYTAVVKHEGSWWYGWIEEVPGVNGQEATRVELVASLRDALIEAVDMNRQDALKAAGSDYQEERIAV